MRTGKVLCKLPRRLVSLVLCLVLLLAVLPTGMIPAKAADGDTTLYLKPGTNWLQDNARFAMYYFDAAGGSGWSDAADADGDGRYEAVLPAGYTSLIFCRMNPAVTGNDWNNMWNQTSDLTLPTDGSNCYTVADDAWSHGSGTWSVYTPAYHLYLKVGAWNRDGARFAAYCFSSMANGWIDLTDAGNGYFECDVPMSYTNVIFARMNGAAAENNWDNKWNQTGDLSIPADGKNCYAIPDDNAWNQGSLTDSYWEVYIPSTAPVETDYYVCGEAGLCGSAWVLADENCKMTRNAETGLYEKCFENIEADTYEFKVNDGTWSNSWGSDSGNCKVTVEELSNVTVTFDETTYTVDAIVEPVGGETPADPWKAIRAVGNGMNNWLHGVSWNPAADENLMTEITDNVFSITYTGLEAYDNYQVKFAANGSWADNWGGVFGGFDVETDAVYNSGDNITIDTTDYEVCDVTLLLDLSNYNETECTGAKFTVSVVDKTPAPVSYYLVGYLNGADVNDAAEENRFVDGKLTRTFTDNTYVAILATDGTNSTWYMTDGWQGDAATSATLYDRSTLASPDKLKVPANTEVEFTLVENGDGTLTLSYTAEVVQKAYDYYVAGAEGLCGVSWQPDSSANGMSLNADGLYEKNYYNVAAGTYEFKVTDGSWSNAWGANGEVGNYSFNLTEKSNVTVFFDADTHEITLQVESLVGKTTVTIHFLKPTGWGDLNIYGWLDGGVGLFGSWPGSAEGIEPNPLHAGWYDKVVAQDTPTAFSFIFNDGRDQTADLNTGAVTGDKEIWVMNNQVWQEAPGIWSGVYIYNVDIHFHNTAEWTPVNIKFGQGSSWTPVAGYESYANNEFGGEIGPNPDYAGWYTMRIRVVDNNEHLEGLFNNGAWGEGNQTANWQTGELVEGENVYWFDGELLSEQPDSWVNQSRKVYIPGTFPGPNWDPASNEMTYDPDTGLYVYTFENVPAANYQFKIAIDGSWDENYGADGVKGGDNISVTVPREMDVTVYYSDRTHLAVTNVDYVFADVTLSGGPIDPAVKMTDPGLTGTYTTVCRLNAGTHSGITITCGDKSYVFADFTISSQKSVTFYFDPVTELYYHDGSDVKVNTNAIYYDSQDLNYKNPFGAVKVGEDVTFAIESGADVTAVKLIVKGAGSYDMTAIENEYGGKLWSVTASFAEMGSYSYYFALSNGGDLVVYGDDDGYYGPGTTAELSRVKPYDLIVYAADFETPDWMKNAVIYQIFPDRFFDADESNNLAQTWARGEADYEYISDWYTLPENPQQEGFVDEGEITKEQYLATGAHWGDRAWSNEIYGGDLQGIIQKVDYLKALGVNVIYLNPVFWSISNHRYDAVDYTEIDPILGTLGDFEELVAVAEANDMHIILDGVFNHVSDDSIYFDRYYRFLEDDEKLGAYPYWAYVYDAMAEGMSQTDAEAAARAFFSETYGVTDYSYTEWFKVSQQYIVAPEFGTETYKVTSNPEHAAKDNIGLRAGLPVYTYEGWWGYDSMPVIYSTDGSEYRTGNWAEEIIWNAEGDSVTQYWISKGNNGWRLDVANEVSDETWQAFRASVKALDSEAVIVGEIWDDATKYLMGDMYDSVMNYLFRNAVTGFARGDLTAIEASRELEKIRERYPEEAFYAMMNLVGSHDTSRLLSYLDGIGDDRDDTSLEAAFPTYETTSDAAKQMQYLVAFLQFTYPGAPTIYYGDEIGMVGADDPDDRRAMEWGKGNKELVEWYARLAAIRAAYLVLRTGDITMIPLNDHVLAYQRTLGDQTAIVAASKYHDTVILQMVETCVDLVSGKTYEAYDYIYIDPYCGVILVPVEDAVEITVDTAALAPAYDPAYIVPERSETPHVHEYTVTMVPPTCEAEGYTLYECSCNHSYKTDFTPMIDHETELVGAKEPTYTEEGYTGDLVCKMCGEIIVPGEAIPVLEREMPPFIPPVHDPEIRFPDVNPGSWYYDDVQYVAQNGLMSGHASGLFGPEEALTRAQLVQTLWRVDGGLITSCSEPFSDVDSGDWFFNAVCWAYDTGVTRGAGGARFEPDRALTRQEIATMLYRYAGSPKADSKVLDRFSDAGEVASWAKDAMAWAVQEGLINGLTATTLAPAARATRAQTAAIIRRYDEYVR